jgi:hypothetical protein
MVEQKTVKCIFNKCYFPKKSIYIPNELEEITSQLRKPDGVK